MNRPRVQPYDILDVSPGLSLVVAIVVQELRNHPVDTICWSFPAPTRLAG